MSNHHNGDDAAAPQRPVLRVVKGTPTDAEVAALVAVLNAHAAAAAATPPPRKRVSEWAAPHRKLRTTYPSGPAGWRASAMPR